MSDPILLTSVFSSVKRGKVLNSNGPSNFWSNCEDKNQMTIFMENLGATAMCMHKIINLLVARKVELYWAAEANLGHGSWDTENTPPILIHSLNDCFHFRSTKDFREHDRNKGQTLTPFCSFSPWGCVRAFDSVSCLCVAPLSVQKVLLC